MNTQWINWLIFHPTIFSSDEKTNRVWSDPLTRFYNRVSSGMNLLRNFVKRAGCMHAIKSQQRQIAQKDRGKIFLSLFFFCLSLFLPDVEDVRGFSSWNRVLTQPAHGPKLRAAVTEQEPPPRREERARFASILRCYLRHSSRPRTPRPLFHSGIITMQFPSASSMGEDCMLRASPPRPLPHRIAFILLLSLSLVLFSPLSPSLHLSLSLPISLLARFSRPFLARESFLVFFPLCLQVFASFSL